MTSSASTTPSTLRQEVLKIYQSLSDPRAEQDGLIRVMDETGEDYLYPGDSFVPISIHKQLKVFEGTVGRSGNP